MTTESDYLTGAKAIGAYLGVSSRRAFYLLENKLIPAAKVGAAHVARKSSLDAAHAAREAVSDSGEAA